MKNKFGLLVTIAVLTGCGGGSSTTNTKVDETTDTFTVALDNSVHEASGVFEKYKVVVYTDAKIEDKPSQSSKAIYGKINGKSTTSLLTINSNYHDGDRFKVKVYDGERLLSQSDEQVLSGDVLEFNDIEL